MKRVIRAFAVLIGLVLTMGLGAGSTKENPGFEKLKTLVGEWAGKTESGMAAHSSYKVVSGGTAVLETLSPADESDMVTLYTADGDRVAMTHYCPTNNQPRMRSEPATAPIRQLDFTFTGATNLASPDTGHMHRLVVSFQDQNHYSQQWTWREQGKDKTEVFHFTRKN